jgi:hypothetical protein
MITDNLIEELEAAFTPKLIQFTDTWDETCRLQGKLEVVQWIKDRQEDMNKEAMVVGDQQVVINHDGPRITGPNVKNAEFLQDNTT